MKRMEEHTTVFDHIDGLNQLMADLDYAVRHHSNPGSPEHRDDVQEALNKLHYDLHKLLENQGLNPLAGCTVTCDVEPPDPWARFDEE